LDLPEESVKNSIPIKQDTKDKKLYIKVDDVNSDSGKKFKFVLSMFPGTQEVIIYYPQTGKRERTYCILDRELINELKLLFGDGNVILK